MSRTSQNAAVLEQSGDAAAVRAARWRAFALLQILFWGGFFLVRAIAAARYYPDLLWSFMGPRIAVVAAYAGLTTIIHLIVRRFPGWRSTQRLALTLLLCALITAPMHALEEWFSAAYATGFPAQQFLDFVSQYGWVLLAWAGYHFAQDRAHDVAQQAAALREAQEAAHAAQMKMLRYQLNPHFLFNSLNAISTLVLENRNKDAEAMLLRLSRFLRHTIDTDPSQLARLGDEAKLQRLYLEMEAVRFGDKLQVICTIPDALHDALVPTLLLQPIIENAIKHGVTHSAAGGHIAIDAQEKNGRLILSVENDGAPFPDNGDAGAGLGLRNTRERLRAIYRENATISIAPREGGGARVVLDLPLRR